MKKLRYGIISASSIVPRFVSALNETKHSLVHAIGSSTLKRSEKLAKKLDIPNAYGSYEEVYTDPEVDVVYIANINDQHFEQIMKALSHKKHVLCEKPMVLTREHAQQAFAFAKEQGVFLMEAQKAAFLPTTKFVKEAIDSKEYGELKQIQISASYANRFPDDHWMYQKHQGGALFGSGSYIIETLLVLLDNPSYEYQAMTHLGQSGEIDDVSIQFNFNKDLLVSTHLSTRVHTENVANFYFEQASISIKDFWKSRKLRVDYHDNEDHDVMKFPNIPEMVYEINHVYDCIHEGLIESPIMSPELTTNTVSLVEEIYKTTV